MNRHTGLIFRDSQGRTRKEQTVHAVGPWTSAGAPHRTVVISDPVAGFHYLLDPERATARRIPQPRLEDLSSGRAGEALREEEVHIEVEAGASEHGDASVEIRKKIYVLMDDMKEGNPPRVDFTLEGPPLMERMDSMGAMGRSMTYRMPTPRVEELGVQIIEGIQAEGRRTVATIPAGEIGNERPIDIVSERWHSPELQVQVRSRHSDPRFGETTYQLSEVVREEPDPALFEVPADFTVEEGFKSRAIRIKKQR